MPDLRGLRMVCQLNMGTIYGEIISYRTMLNPELLCAVVKVDHSRIKVPVDSRQSKFIREAYPVGSTVELKFDGRWHIISFNAPEKADTDNMAHGAS
jgi:hypothetical protein